MLEVFLQAKHKRGLFPLKVFQEGNLTPYTGANIVMVNWTEVHPPRLSTRLNDSRCNSSSTEAGVVIVITDHRPTKPEGGTTINGGRAGEDDLKPIYVSHKLSRVAGSEWLYEMEDDLAYLCHKHSRVAWVGMVCIELEDDLAYLCHKPSRVGWVGMVCIGPEDDLAYLCHKSSRVGWVGMVCIGPEDDTRTSGHWGRLDI
ncbi:hypothetical protein AVEN_252940-1 [Araneus ventricosus]|uniref:Uncharacterized protein n=1 Tax=Araneus ventricosus TaxID=182803 RepID=A0A4Y2WJV7_ARAVE|nr:hypothetical protein AVEN_252940-1 [Araneus ventricosus]